MESSDMIRYAAGEAARRKRNFIVGMIWGVGGVIVCAVGGLWEFSSFSARSAWSAVMIGWLGVGGLLAWLGSLHRRLPCPACGKKSSGAEAVSFHRCNHCDAELFTSLNTSPACPGLPSFPAPPLSGLRLAAADIFIFVVVAALFYLVGSFLPKSSDEIPMRQIAFTVAALPAGVAVLLFLRRRRELAAPRCPVCRQAFAVEMANLSGNCSSCGAALLEVGKPDAPLPSAEKARQFRKKISVLTAFAGVVPGLAGLIAIGFVERYEWLIIGLALVIAIAVIRQGSQYLFKKSGLGGCPNCGAPVSWYFLPRRCPRCGKKVMN